MEKIPGGFDSHETSELFSNNNDISNDKEIVFKNGSKEYALLREMLAAYRNKVYDVDREISTLERYAEALGNTQERAVLEMKIAELEKQWRELVALSDTIQSHLKDGAESLN